MTISEINGTIAALNIIKATVEWDYPLDYQLDIDKAIEGLEELKESRKCRCAVIVFYMLPMLAHIRQLIRLTCTFVANIGWRKRHEN